MEKFIKFLEEDVDFNIEIHNKIQDLKDQKLIDPSFIVFKCSLRLDIIQLNDQDLNLSIYIQQNYPNLDSLIRDYVQKILSEDKQLRNIQIRQEQILPDIEIINGNLTNNLNIYAQKGILQNSLLQNSFVQGQLVLIEYFQVLKIFPLENYYSIKRYSYYCGCNNNDYKLQNTNLILHIIENNQSASLNKQSSNLIKNLSCDICHQEMYEDKEKSKPELCQKVLIYIPERYNSTRNSLLNGFQKEEGKLIEMFLEKQYCNSLSLNQTYSCIAYYSLATSNKQTKNDFLTGFKPLNITEHLFACTISINIKDPNAQFNQQMINQVSLFNCITEQEQLESQMKQNSNDENENFHFKFKQLMFAVDSFFNEATKFSFLQLKTALVMSYVLANSNRILQKNSSLNREGSFSQLNVLFQCESQFVDSIIEEILMTFGYLQSFNVFDCLLQFDIASSLVKSNNSILLIKNIQDISKQQQEQLNKILQNQEIYFDQLKTKLNLNVTIWAFNSTSKQSGKIKKFKSDKNISQSFEQYFDVCLSQDKSVLSLKDYHLLIQNEVDMFLDKELQMGQKFSRKAHHELSTEKKHIHSKSNRFNEQMSTLKKEKSSQNQHVQALIGDNYKNNNEEEAHCLLNKFINTVRNSMSAKEINYSTSNISSLSKFAIASSIFRNVFIKNNSQELISCEENSRVIIDTFDAFLSIFFNILSRKIFCRDLDTKYFLSFIVNYGSGYLENSEMRIPQEKEFFIALEKIQDQILDFIRF